MSFGSKSEGIRASGSKKIMGKSVFIARSRGRDKAGDARPELEITLSFRRRSAG